MFLNLEGSVQCVAFSHNDLKVPHPKYLYSVAYKPNFFLEHSNLTYAQAQAFQGPRMHLA